MGFIKAGMGVLGGMLADQRKEYFCCEGMGKEVMVTKAGGFDRCNALAM